MIPLTPIGGFVGNAAAPTAASILAAWRPDQKAAPTSGGSGGGVVVPRALVDGIAAGTNVRLPHNVVVAQVPENYFQKNKMCNSSIFFSKKSVAYPYIPLPIKTKR
jgi:hypothetical protein